MISFVLCFYKNFQNVNEVYRSIIEYVNNELEYEIIFVNDNCPDLTWSTIKKIAEKDDKVKALCFTKNYGQQSAIEAGLRLSSGEKILYFDSDKILDINFIKQAKNICDHKNPLIWGDQEIKNNFLRKLFSIIYFIIFKRRYHYRSVFLIHKSLNENIFKYYNQRNKIIGEILTEITNDAKKIKCDFKNQDNQTRYNFFKLFLLGFKHLLNKSKNFYSIFMMMNILIGTFTVLISFIFFVLKIFNVVDYLDGWISTILIISFFSSLILIITSLMGITLMRILKEVQKKPNYNIAEKKNIK